MRRTLGQWFERLGLALLMILVCIWTLPQTLVGAALSIYRRCQGVHGSWVRFGPLLVWLVPADPPGGAGVSLGVVMHTGRARILKHECCHLITGLWLNWFYLPMYGMEYLVFGHRRSPHERLTCWIERSIRWEPRLMEGVFLEKPDRINDGEW